MNECSSSLDLDYERTTINIPAYQPKNCGSPIRKDMPGDKREAYRIAKQWAEDGHHCCTVEPDSSVKVWQASGLVKVEKVDKRITFICCEDMELEYPK